ncbi:MAG: hypothetical protein KC680_00995 [Candidatus Peregrinibacteria bacterium]|nr:hypothetical protein [Candidatus Peregrinibacteria bacterium]MCB9808113.1 hypothetical protein [Candidatus Peribacteria bacterium]
MRILDKRSSKGVELLAMSYLSILQTFCASGEAGIDQTKQCTEVMAQYQDDFRHALNAVLQGKTEVLDAIATASDYITDLSGSAYKEQRAQLKDSYQEIIDREAKGKEFSRDMWNAVRVLTVKHIHAVAGVCAIQKMASAGHLRTGAQGVVHDEQVISWLEER